MIITAMTATFGTLSNATMRLKSGMNLRTLPNETGKSTWVAFLTAMFYGVSAKERAGKNTISDKARYQPWNGDPMQGILELIWQDRPLRISRTSSSRGPMAEFQATWLDTGEPVAGMTGDNCGRLLLGVDRAEYERSALIRHNASAVEPSPEPAQRLGALITSGDANVSCSRVIRTLKNWQNQRQYHNSGLLPEAISRRDALAEQLKALSDTEEITVSGSDELAELVARRQALIEASDQAPADSADPNELAEAEAEVQRTERAASALREQVLPPLNEIDQLLQNLDAIEKDAQNVSAMPRTADGVTSGVQLAVFNGLSREQAAEKAAEDVKVYRKLHRAAARAQYAQLLSVLASALAIISALLLRVVFAYLVSVMLVVFGAAYLVLLRTNAQDSARAKADAILAAYGAEDETGIVAAGEAYLQSQSGRSAGYTAAKAELSRRVSAIRAAVSPLGRADSIRSCRDTLQAARLRRIHLDRAEEEARQARSFRNCLNGSADPAQDGQDDVKTELAELDSRIAELRSSAPQKQDDRIQLQRQLELADRDIARLRMELTALDMAASAMDSAAETLQSRVSQQLTEPASRYLQRMTDGRYAQVRMDRELSITVSPAEGGTESPLSAGTADQLYLSLQLAVCETTLDSDVPIVLDDALLTFDDERLGQAMRLLRELAAQRQILFFSCSGREVRWSQAHPADV